MAACAGSMGAAVEDGKYGELGDRVYELKPTQGTSDLRYSRISEVLKY